MTQGAYDDPAVQAAITATIREQEVRREFALEADPGKLTASFPTFPTFEGADWAAQAPCMTKPGLPPVRILTRVDGGPWEVAS